MNAGAVARAWYDEGHPAGYTDDLGIIADRNQWIKGAAPGWYFLLAPYGETDVSALDVRSWCEDNMSGHWTYNGSHSFYLADDGDAALFKLRWA